MKSVSRHRTILFGALSALVLLTPGAVQAQRGWGSPGWGGSGWGGFGRDGFDPDHLDRPDRSREGHITVSRFVSDSPLVAGLGHGAIAVSPPPPGDQTLLETQRALFEGALVQQLARAGYDTGRAQAEGGQVVELTVTHTELEPPGAPHKPVSGEMDMSVGNRGTGFGAAIAVDMSKPLPPLIATRLEARIRDRATGVALWEGRAEVATRPGAKGWNSQQTADRLTAALLDGFPRAGDKVSRKR